MSNFQYLVAAKIRIYDVPPFIDLGAGEARETCSFYVRFDTQASGPPAVKLKPL